MPEQGNEFSVDLKVKLNGSEAVADQVMSVQVESDLNQPDMSVITLRNDEHKYSNEVNQADAVEVSVGSDIIFKGEVVGIEPRYQTDGPAVCVVRAFNKMHRLLRGRKSRTFLEQSDQDIASAIAGDAGLTAVTGSDPQITHEHVYQHNQTDMEFLRVRAARCGFDVWVDGTDLHFEVPEAGASPVVSLVMGSSDSETDRVGIKYFAPRISSSALVKKVIVRGWDPENKEEIVGEASAASSPLGSKNASSAAGDFGQTETYEVDHPIFSVAEANAIAKARLGEASMGYITGDGECEGNAKLKAGVVVDIKINVDDAADRFNGKYMLVGVTHLFDDNGYRSVMRVSRDATSDGATGGAQESELE